MILIVDGMNLFIRGFVANPSMSENGFHVGGVVGFLNGLRNCIEKFKPTDLFVIWEESTSKAKSILWRRLA